MRPPVSRYAGLLLLLVMSVGSLAQNKLPTYQSWLTQYTECRDYGQVYVVKKVSSSCRSYETFLTDTSGHRLTPAYRDIGDFEEGLAEFVPMKRSQAGYGRHGFIDKQGKIVIQPNYIATDRFRQGKTWVIYATGLHYGLAYIDKTGKQIYRLPIQYFTSDFLRKDATIRFVCNHDAQEDVLWWRGGEVFILNFNFTPFVQQQIQRSTGIVPFHYKGKFGVITPDLILKVPVALDDIDVTYSYSGQGLQRVKYGARYGYINPVTGELVVPFAYTDTRRPTNGLFWVKKQGKWGCINNAGQLRIPHVYDEASGFTAEGLSAVAIQGKFGHIDWAGQIRTPLVYDFASFHRQGIALVRLKDKYGYIDTRGRLLTSLRYDAALPFEQARARVERCWLKFELSRDGQEHLVGPSYKLNALLILVGMVVFIWISSLLARVLLKFRPAR